MVNGKREWVTYSTLAVEDEDFMDIERDYRSEHSVTIHKVGDADTMLLDQREVVDWTVKWLGKNRTL